MAGLPAVRAAVQASKGVRKMFGRGRSTAHPTEWAGSTIDTLRPYVEYAMSDADLRDELRRLADVASRVSAQLQGKPAPKAARRVATDRKLQRSIGEGAQMLGDVAVRVAGVGLLSLAGLAGAAAMRRMRDAGSEVREAAAAAGSNGGTTTEAVRPAGSPTPS
jgi:hypothetical protein